MATYDSVPVPRDPSHLGMGYGTSSRAELSGEPDSTDFAHNGKPIETSPFAQTAQEQRPETAIQLATERDASTPPLTNNGVGHRSASRASTLNAAHGPSRTGTLKKNSSVKRSGSKKDMARGLSVKRRGAPEGMTEEEYNSAFYTPVPTTGSPTDILADRFQAWRKVLKDLTTYFREVQISYENRSKSFLRMSNVIGNVTAPSVFVSEGGLRDAMLILTDYSRQALMESNKSKDIENEVITQLSGLRSDLNQKIKEIKGLSGDFRSSVDKEKDATRRAVIALTDALDAADTDPGSSANKGDPYLMRLRVDRQVERQLDEENYLHRAYLNLESSGRELEAIVVGEIQKAYNAYAGILKREADASNAAIESLRSGPIAMPKDFEWNKFVEHDPHFVDPKLPLRRVEDIKYAGRHHPMAVEIRAGMLERKSKYLKSYTPGWYVLSPTHLHEFKSADRIHSQPPVMSLYLAEQKLGSYSQADSSSHKFMLKGRQTGSMHRGHSWVFRAESHETMMAWYSDIKALTGEGRTDFVRKHARSISTTSQKAVSLVSSDGGMEEDEADAVPYSATNSVSEPILAVPTQRPQPGGRFPSDIQVNRTRQEPLVPSSDSSDNDRDVSAVAVAVAPSSVQQPPKSSTRHADSPHPVPVTAVAVVSEPPVRQPVDYYEDTAPVPYAGANDAQHQPGLAERYVQPAQPSYIAYSPPPQQQQGQDAAPIPKTTDSQISYLPAVAASSAAAAAILGADTYRKHDSEPAAPVLAGDIHRNHDSEPAAPLREYSYGNFRGAATAVTANGRGNTAGTTSGAGPTSAAGTTSAVDGSSEAADDVQPPIHPHPHVSTQGNQDVHPTGALLPAVVRHNTGFSVSDLHVPGEFPPTPVVQ